MSEYYELNKKEYSQKKMILCVDFNIAPYENDVWNHKQLLKIISHTQIEIQRINRLKESLDFVDVAREFIDESQKAYTWWSYRNPNWQTNDKGRRLDHIWVSPNIKNLVKEFRILKHIRSWERPSDHVPVIIELEI